MRTFYTQKTDDLFINVFVKPGSAADKIIGIHSDSNINALKIKLTAPPVEGEANKALIKFLAILLKIGKTRIEIIKGHRSRLKVVRLKDMTKEKFSGFFPEIINQKRT